jgi:putative NADH-flavin reductase
MKLLVLGPTGGTGQAIVRQALDAGHDVCAFARRPAKLGIEHPRLRVHAGDVVADPAALAEALRGQDAVVSALGKGQSFKASALIERSVRALVPAMESAGVRRLVFTSAFGVGDSVRGAPIVARVFFATLLRGVYADKKVGEDLLRASALEWTIVQPAMLTDGPRTGKYRTGRM